MKLFLRVWNCFWGYEKVPFSGYEKNQFLQKKISYPRVWKYRLFFPDVHEERACPCLVPSNRTLHYRNTGIVTDPFPLRYAADASVSRPPNFDFGHHGRTMIFAKYWHLNTWYQNWRTIRKPGLEDSEIYSVICRSGRYNKVWESCTMFEMNINSSVWVC